MKSSGAMEPTPKSRPEDNDNKLYHTSFNIASTRKDRTDWYNIK